jgi:hypothetical protein
MWLWKKRFASSAGPQPLTRARETGHARRELPSGHAPKLTPETTEIFFNRYKNSSNAAASADACGIGERTLYDWLERGERQLRGKYRDFLDAFTKLRGEIRDIPAARHRRIALGGIEKKPKRRTYMTDKGFEVVTDEILRNEAGDIEFVEVWREPDPRALEWLLARQQPELYGNPELRVNVQHNGDRLACGQTPAEVGSLLVDRFVGALAALKESGALTRPAQIEVTASAPAAIPAEMLTTPVEDAKPEKPTPDDPPVEDLL